MSEEEKNVIFKIDVNMLEKQKELNNQLNSMPQIDELKKQKVRTKFRLQKVLIQLLLLAIILITLLYLFGLYLNFFMPLKYGKVFKTISIHSKYEKETHLPSIELKLQDIEIKHLLLPSSNRHGVTTQFRELNLLEKMFKLFKLNLDYKLKKENFIHIFNSEKKFNFLLKKLNEKKKKNDDVKCHEVSIENNLAESNGEIEACMKLGKSSWYGGHESLDQPFWPINNQTFDSVPYVTGFPDIWGAVVERYWLSSAGFAIYFDDDVPLLVNHSDPNLICFKSSRESAPYKYTTVYGADNLKYTMCSGSDMKSVHLHMLDLFFKKPKTAPDALMMQSPVFTTWNYFFKQINQSVIMDFAAQIKANNYSVSQLEIDDKWEEFYGDLDFDRNKFPNVKEMVDRLHSMGIRVTLWVHPFCNIDSSNFIKGAFDGLWVLQPDGKNPALTQWWNGQHAAILDTTNPESIQYFNNKLNYLKNEYGIDSFKFDAGESSWCPTEFKYFDKTAKADAYSQNYVKLAAAQNNFIEVRTAHGVQDLGIFFRLLDRATDWSIHDGIKSVVTATLQFGLLGYPFVLPDIIGGNGDPDKSNKELFIRWTQLTAFLPAMQFGVPPWYFDEETNQIAKKFVAIHENQVYPYIKSLELDGQPIVRPMWWLEPTNKLTFSITDQFLVGDKLLVAPILDAGLKSRSIYFPSGYWVDVEQLCMYSGPTTIRNYTVTLDVIPYFYDEKWFKQLNKHVQIKKKCAA